MDLLENDHLQDRHSPLHTVLHHSMSSSIIFQHNKRFLIIASHVSHVHFLCRSKEAVLQALAATVNRVCHNFSVFLAML